MTNLGRNVKTMETGPNSAFLLHTMHMSTHIQSHKGTSKYTFHSFTHNYTLTCIKNTETIVHSLSHT